ncbi:MAG: tRNA-dihydrouridine synthase [Archaeoglobaceae archaeon]
MKVEFSNRVVLSAMAGINNAEFCKQHPVGLAVLGGFNADDASNSAAEEVVKRGRKEFVLDDPRKGIEQEVRSLRESNKNFALNIRSAHLDGYLMTAEIAERYGGLLEINAHCRQPEFMDIGCGQWLMYHPQELASVIKEISHTADVPVGVKMRGGISGVDYLQLSKILKSSGCSFIHLDAMIEGGGCDLKLISRLAKENFVIGNNSVSNIASAEMMLVSEAKLVSAARSPLRDSQFFERLLESDELREPLEVEFN